MPKIKNINAFILDLDGVLTDTSVMHEKAWRKLAQEEGIAFNDDMSNDLRGVSRRESLNIILKNSNKTYSEDEIQKLMEKKNTYYNQNLEELTPKNIIPGVAALIDLLRTEKYLIAVASASKNALKVLKKIGLRDCFDVITEGNELTKSKPDPQIFILTANKLHQSPENCIVIEDAQSGIESANAGGFFSIGIGPDSRFNDKNNKPSLRFDSILDLIKYLVPLVSY